MWPGFYIRKLGGRSDRCKGLAMHIEIRSSGGLDGWEHSVLEGKLSKDSSP